MKRVFFVVYGGGHVNLAMPLIKELRKDDFYETNVLGLSIAMKSLKQEKIAYKSIADFESVIMDDLAWRLGRELADKWHVDGKGIDRKESEIYLGSSMRDVVMEIGEEEAFCKINENGRRAFYPVNTMQKIVDYVKPDLIVTTNVPRMERAAVKAGLNMGIPTIAIHDYLRFEKRHKLEADKIAVMCDITLENLVKAGHDREKIVVTGQPVFDQIPAEMEVFPSDDLPGKWQLPENKRFILLGTQPNPTSQVMVESAINAVSQLDGYELIIKPHPGEDIRNYEKWILGKKDVHLRPDAPIRELIFCSDLTITFSSTVGFESVLMEKPLIQLNLTGNPNPVPLYQYGVSLNVEDRDNLLSTIKQCLHNLEFKDAFEKCRNMHFGHIIHGEGTGNITALIKRVLSNREQHVQ